MTRNCFASRRTRACLFTLLLSLLAATASGEELSDLFGDNARATVDFSVRQNHTDGHYWSMHAAGFDLHKVVSTRRGDVGTLVFQPYVVKLVNAPGVPPIFDHEDDAALQWRIANFNYTGLAQGRFNVRIGHFELPFGLEHVVPTNGTLHQMNAPASIGLKADWGMSVNGFFPEFEYEFAAMRGAGNDLSTDANGIVVGRIGSRRDRRLSVGVSFMDGEMERGCCNFIERRRAGIDATLLLPRGFQIGAEYAAGEDDGEGIEHAFADVRWLSPSESLLTYVQWRRASTDTISGYTSSFAAGLRYEPDGHWNVDLQLQHSLNRASNVTSTETVSVQLRYRL